MALRFFFTVLLQFSFENCKFHVEKGKEGTSRVVVWSMGVQNSYTLEASMGGSKIGSRGGTHFSIQDYEQIGKTFCETLLDFFDQDPTKVKIQNRLYFLSYYILYYTGLVGVRILFVCLPQIYNLVNASSRERIYIYGKHCSITEL